MRFQYSRLRRIEILPSAVVFVLVAGLSSSAIAEPQCSQTSVVLSGLLPTSLKPREQIPKFEEQSQNYPSTVIAFGNDEQRDSIIEVRLVPISDGHWVAEARTALDSKVEDINGKPFQSPVALISLDKSGRQIGEGEVVVSSNCAGDTCPAFDSLRLKLRNMKSTPGRGELEKVVVEKSSIDCSWVSRKVLMTAEEAQRPENRAIIKDSEGRDITDEWYAKNMKLE